MDDVIIGRYRCTFRANVPAAWAWAAWVLAIGPDIWEIAGTGPTPQAAVERAQLLDELGD